MISDLILLLLASAVAILLWIWVCTHWILASIADLNLHVEAFRRILSEFIIYEDLERWDRSEDGLRAKSGSKL